VLVLANVLRIICLLSLLAAAGCATFQHPLPAVNLSEPGWKVRQGQAVWQLPNGRPEVAGEVLLATHPGGKGFVQFSKSPFTLAMGQTTAQGWQIEFPPQNKKYSAPGSPPKRLIWLQLLRVMSGQKPPTGWNWSESEENFRLQNPASGEAVEGYFAQ